MEVLDCLGDVYTSVNSQERLPTGSRYDDALVAQLHR